ncbi:Ycf2-like protein [Medicago truncatula]|uniref:Ycf2-like protein n=1 Tax=Medicago truncatula TaxID=3880 RepID=G7ID35_MEDTR|nr:Ycf2-like protein [Medicago truncatula]
MNKDPNAYKYKWSNGSKNFQEQLDHFISEQNSRFQVVFNRFQVVFDRLHMNAYSIDWSEVIDKKDLSKSLYFFLSKFLPFLSKSLYFFLSKFLPFLSNSLPFFFVSFGNIPVHRSEIHVYELKRPNDPLGNQLLESIGLQIVHLKKRKPFLLDDFYTSKKSKLSFNEGTISPFLFNKRENWISFRRAKRALKYDSPPISLCAYPPSALTKKIVDNVILWEFLRYTLQLRSTSTPIS